MTENTAQALWDLQWSGRPGEFCPGVSEVKCHILVVLRVGAPLSPVRCPVRHINLSFPFGMLMTPYALIQRLTGSSHPLCPPVSSVVSAARP